MLEILKIILPAALVIVAAYLILTKMLTRDENRLRLELAKANQSVALPLRLAAYERLALLLERTMPSTLLIASFTTQMTCLELQQKLTETIRKEFQHNATQQIYVSIQLWRAIRTSEESLLGLINTCAGQLNPNDNATMLAEMLINVFSATENTPSEMALEMLKNEVRTII